MTNILRNIDKHLFYLRMNPKCRTTTESLFSFAAGEKSSANITNSVKLHRYCNDLARKKERQRDSEILLLEVKLLTVFIVRIFFQLKVSSESKAPCRAKSQVDLPKQRMTLRNSEREGRNGV